jgi:hypothetical protein
MDMCPMHRPFKARPNDAMLFYMQYIKERYMHTDRTVRLGAVNLRRRTNLDQYKLHINKASGYRLCLFNMP